MLGGAALALAGCTRAGTPRASTVPAPLTPADFSLVIDGLDHAAQRRVLEWANDYYAERR